MSAIAKAMTSETGGKGAEQELGPHTRTYQVGFDSTTGLMILGACLVAVPVLAGIGISFDRQPSGSPFQFALFMAAIFFPLGIPALVFGMRQRRVRLSRTSMGSSTLCPRVSG
ncbi:MAG: hypothetical protein GC200_12660 [Tepidisphaera sp.]|nr:hypothetical protein [Tepidisphaera sp.]